MATALQVQRDRVGALFSQLVEQRGWNQTTLQQALHEDADEGADAAAESPSLPPPAAAMMASPLPAAIAASASPLSCSTPLSPPVRRVMITGRSTVRRQRRFIPTPDTPQSGRRNQPAHSAALEQIGEAGVSPADATASAQISPAAVDEDENIHAAPLSCCSAASAASAASPAPSSAMPPLRDVSNRRSSGHVAQRLSFGAAAICTPLKPVAAAASSASFPATTTPPQPLSLSIAEAPNDDEAVQEEEDDEPEQLQPRTRTAKKKRIIISDSEGEDDDCCGASSVAALSTPVSPVNSSPAPIADTTSIVVSPMIAAPAASSNVLVSSPANAVQEEAEPEWHSEADEEEPDTPPQPVRKRIAKKRIIISDSEDECDETPVAAASSSPSAASPSSAASSACSSLSSSSSSSAESSTEASSSSQSENESDDDGHESEHCGSPSPVKTKGKGKPAIQPQASKTAPKPKTKQTPSMPKSNPQGDGKKQPPQAKSKPKRRMVLDSDECDSDDRDFIATSDEDEEDEDESFNEEEEESDDGSEDERSSASEDEDGSNYSDEDSDCSDDALTRHKTPARQPLVAAVRNISGHAFKRQRVALLAAAYAEFNTRIFDGRLDQSLPLLWSKTLRTTAGMCVHNRIGGVLRIEMSIKVCDDESKMRETLVHEMCHAAVWALDRAFNAPPHGRLFKTWGRLVTRKMPSLGVVDTCHHYVIFKPFRWKCTSVSCGKVFSRHSDSIDVAKHACGRCRAPLQRLGRFTADGTPAKVRPPTAFASYVQQQYSATKMANPATPHRDVMKLLASGYKQAKESGMLSLNASPCVTTPARGGIGSSVPVAAAAASSASGPPGGLVLASISEAQADLEAQMARIDLSAAAEEEEEEEHDVFAFRERQYI